MKVAGVCFSLTLLACSTPRANTRTASAVPIETDASTGTEARDVLDVTDLARDAIDAPTEAIAAEPPPDVPGAPVGWSASACETVPEDLSCVAGGPFIRGMPSDSHRCDQEGRPHMSHADTVSQQTIWLSTFYMDRYEVTVHDYYACIRAGRCARHGPVYPDFNHPRQPITGITWYDAVDYCHYRGKHLPTESEWEKAARGPDGRLSPWGDAPVDCSLAVYMNESGRSCGVHNAAADLRDKGRVLDVGSRPAGIYGLFDMVGNAEEWVFDWYTPSWDECGEACLGVDPKGPCNGAERCAGMRMRGVRGGSWYWPASHATGYHRRPHYPDNTRPYHHFGFRCAASVTEASAIVSSLSVRVDP